MLSIMPKGIEKGSSGENSAEERDISRKDYMEIQEQWFSIIAFLLLESVMFKAAVSLILLFL